MSVSGYHTLGSLWIKLSDDNSCNNVSFNRRWGDFVKRNSRFNRLSCLSLGVRDQIVHLVTRRRLCLDGCMRIKIQALGLPEMCYLLSPPDYGVGIVILSGVHFFFFIGGTDKISGTRNKKEIGRIPLFRVGIIARICGLLPGKDWCGWRKGFNGLHSGLG